MMKRYIKKIYSIAPLAAGIALFALTIHFTPAFIVSAVAQSEHSDHAKYDMHKSKTYEDLYVCAMHPWEAADHESECSICGMSLSRVEGHTINTPLPDESDIYIDSDNPMMLFAQPGDGRIPITESPYYQPRQKTDDKSSDKDAHNHENTEGMHEKESEEPSITSSGEEEKTLWTCGMHPNVIQEEPGICPICQMELTPLKSGTASGGKGIVSIDPVTLQSIGVRTAVVERRDLFREIRSDGIVTVAEDQKMIVNSRVDGWIEKLFVNTTGERVKAGDPLLEIYSPALLNAQEEYLLALEKQSSARLVEAAKRRLELWEISDEQIQRISDSGEVQRTLILVAPANGTVLEKFIVEGSHVKAGNNLFSIAELNPIWIRTNIYEFELPWVSKGDRVSVVNPYNQDVSVEGTLDFIYPVLDPKHRTAELRIVLDNPKLLFMPEMFVDVRIFANPVYDVIAVPKEAVIRSGKRDLVFVKLDAGKFEPREVHLGMETDTYYEITHNLEEGEQVVTSGQFLLDSEAKLQEAVQRRIAGLKSTDNSAMPAHQH